MSALRRAVLRLGNAVWPGRAEQQLDREMTAHLAMLEEDLERRGLTREQAAVAARRRAGGLDRVRDLQRDARSFVWLDDARGDLLYAARMLARTPGFTCLALLTLALGIGSVTVIYSVIHAVLLDPLPYPGSERFVNVQVQDRDTGRLRNVLPAAEFLDYQEQSRVFDDVIGTRGDSMLLTSPERTEVLRVVRVTPNFFDVMGLRPLLGRTAGPADARPDAPPVAVLRHRAWVSYFGSDPGIVGTTIRLNGEPSTTLRPASTGSTRRRFSASRRFQAWRSPPQRQTSLRSWEGIRARSGYRAFPATIVPRHSSSSALKGISGPSVCGSCEGGNCPAWLSERNPELRWSTERSSPAISGLRIPSENISG